MVRDVFIPAFKGRFWKVWEKVLGVRRDTLVRINLTNLRENTRRLVERCQQEGVLITGVTKATFGLPQVARTMIQSGVISIGESRLESVKRLKTAGIRAPLMMLRIPSLNLAKDIVLKTDISLNSERTVIEALSDAAVRHGRVHKIVLMIDLGDLREGVMPKDVEPLVERVLEMPGVQLVGVGTNLTCYGGVIPTEKNLGRLVDCGDRLVGSYGVDIQYVSGGNSSTLPLLFSGKLPAAVNHLRLGESILLGRETATSTQWPGASSDVFELSSELIEIKIKPSLPIGETGMDAFGRKVSFENRGNHRRGIVNLGRADLDVDGLVPIDPNITILGASSDHLLVDLSATKTPKKLGDRLTFRMAYSALIGAMSSDSISRDIVEDESRETEISQVALVCRDVGDGRNRSLLPDIAARIDELGCDVVSTTITGSDQVFEQALNDAISCEGRLMVTGGNAAVAQCALSQLVERHGPLGVVWIDAQPGLVSESEPAEILTGAFGSDEALDLLTNNVVVIGLREGSPAQVLALVDHEVSVFTMEDIDLLGIQEVIDKCLRQTSAGTAGVFVYLNPAVMEDSDQGRQKALTCHETSLILECISDSEHLRGLVVAQSPKGFSETLAEQVNSVTLSAFGRKTMHSPSDLEKTAYGNRSMSGGHIIPSNKESQ